MSIRQSLTKGLAAIVLASALSSSNANAEQYTIQKGDNLYQLAKNHGVSVQQIQNYNKNLDPKHLQIGQVINIPENPKVEEYKIQEGDTLYSLSRKHGLTTNDIVNYSEIDPEHLQIGQVIRFNHTKKDCSLSVKKDKSPNFKVGRSKNIEGIVIHSTEGSGNGAISWLKNSKSKASAHYVIKENGEIVQLVDDKDTAWHVGKNGNPGYIGIEFAGYADKNGFKFTEAQYKSAGVLSAYLMKQYNLRDSNIVSHAWVTDNLKGTTHKDPGKNFSWSTLFGFISEYKGMNIKKGE